MLTDYVNMEQMKNVIFLRKWRFADFEVFFQDSLRQAVKNLFTTYVLSKYVIHQMFYFEWHCNHSFYSERHRYLLKKNRHG